MAVSQISICAIKVVYSFPIRLYQISLRRVSVRQVALAPCTGWQLPWSIVAADVTPSLLHHSTEQGRVGDLSSWCEERGDCLSSTLWVQRGGEYATLDCGVRRVARSCCGIQPHHTLIWICVSVVRVCLLSDIALVYRDIVVVHYLIISVSRIDKYLPSPHFHNLYRH